MNLKGGKENCLVRLANLRYSLTKSEKLFSYVLFTLESCFRLCFWGVSDPEHLFHQQC